jgi:hypothetical protein
MMVGAHHELRGLSAILARWIVVAGLVVGLSQPRELVWCQAGPGHSALEDLDADCCRAPSGEASCTQDLDAPGGPALDGTESAEGDGCTDVLVEAPSRLPLGKRFSSRQAAALLLASRAGLSPLQVCFPSMDRGDAIRNTARALSPFNVLRI